MHPTAPYVVPWKEETLPDLDTMVGSFGVAYTNPLHDTFQRDKDGILWAVCEGTRAGGPAYARELHPHRQREAMERLLCAGCSGPPARDERGMLWVLPLLDDGDDPGWHCVRTVIPPMCEPCKTKATEACPWLRDGHVELRVKEAEKIGVRGTLYPPPGVEDEPDPDALVLFDTPEEGRVIARQLVRELREVTVIAVRRSTP
ncbi:hypothetical protein [Streptomyces sp. S1]|uniref:hypothetical protein n=1 Tax=Streptomyces sp. S1 TaxID=718288 RepID=UPI000EF7718A|nr:hypothetical protein [Streptomyces sp. S1]